jgi:hypothetical protein
MYNLVVAGVLAPGYLQEFQLVVTANVTQWWGGRMDIPHVCGQENSG